MSREGRGDWVLVWLAFLTAGAAAASAALYWAAGSRLVAAVWSVTTVLCAYSGVLEAKTARLRDRTRRLDEEFAQRGRQL